MSAPTSLLTRAAATWGVESPEYLALSAVVDAAALGARTLQATLDAAGYEAGSCTDEWTPSIRAAVAALRAGAHGDHAERIAAVHVAVVG